MDITSNRKNLGLGAFGTATVKVADVLGNAATGISDDNGGVTVSATGKVRLRGFLASQPVNTDTNGTATVIASNTAGAGGLTAVPTNATDAGNTPAVRPTYTKPIDVPAPALSLAATRSITITGASTTVSGKPGMMIVGVVTGIEDGKTDTPTSTSPVRLPSQRARHVRRSLTDRSRGTARQAGDSTATAQVMIAWRSQTASSSRRTEA